MAGKSEDDNGLDIGLGGERSWGNNLAWQGESEGSTTFLGAKSVKPKCDRSLNGCRAAESCVSWGKNLARQGESVGYNTFLGAEIHSVW